MLASLFLPTEIIHNIAANSLKRYEDFTQWVDGFVIHISGYQVDANVVIESDIERKWLLSYRYCQGWLQNIGIYSELCEFHACI